MGWHRFPRPWAVVGFLAGAVSLLCATDFWVIVIARRLGYELSPSDGHVCFLVLAWAFSAATAFAGGSLALALADGPRPPPFRGNRLAYLALLSVVPSAVSAVLVVCVFGYFA
jgi:hypothetical protein